MFWAIVEVAGIADDVGGVPGLADRAFPGAGGDWRRSHDGQAMRR